MMREYGKIAPTFWTRGSGKRLRGDALAQAIAFHLCTSTSATMTGLYYMPIATIAHETGHAFEDVKAALDRIATAGFAFYDPDFDLVWIPNGAEIQIAPRLAPKDNRRASVERELTAFARQFGAHPFLRAFYMRYADPFGIANPFETPSRPLPEGSRTGFVPVRDGSSDVPGIIGGTEGFDTPLQPLREGSSRARAHAPALAPDPALGLEGVQGERRSAPPPSESVSRVRVRAVVDEEPFPMPDEYALSPDARASAETLGLPAGDVEDEWINFRARQIRDGRTFTARAWLAAWTQWCVRAKQFRSERNGRDITRTGPHRTKLQPAPDNAPWMREGYNDATADAWKGGT